MKKKPLPHHDLLDRVQLAVIPIIHELPLIQSMLKWAKHITEGTTHSHPMGWMLISENDWSQERQIEKLSQLAHSTNELGKALKPLVSKLKEFHTEHQKIERAIFTLNATYREIPLIDPDIQLLKLGHSLFENPDLVAHLYQYVEKTSHMLTKAAYLKQVLFDDVINSLSVNPPTEEPRISTSFD